VKKGGQAVATLELKESVKKAKEWLQSAEAQARLQEIRRNALAVKARLSKARRVDPKRLHQPINL
jgi:hypothetical protein